MNIPLNSLIKVVWRDICGTCKWMDTDQALEFGKRTYDANHITVGYLLHLTTQFLILAATYDGEGGYNDVSMIPRANVKKIVRLKG